MFRRLTGWLQGPLSFVSGMGSRRRGRALRRRAISLEELEPRQLLTLLTYGGGPLLTQVEVQAVYLGSDWAQNNSLSDQTSQIDGYLKYIVNSPYMDMLNQAGYGVGRGSSTPGAIDPVALNKSKFLSDAQIESYLQSAITGSSNRLAPPDANRFYTVYVEPGVEVGDASSNSKNDFAGYHSSFQGQDANGRTANIRYAVMPYPGNPNTGPYQFTNFQFLTEVTSHELAEAVTDPDPATGWYDWTDNEENGDLVAWQTVILNGYTVQKEADKNGNAMDPNDFATVALAAPQLTATPTSPWTVSLSWTASSGATGYYVDWNDGSTIHSVATLGPSQTSFQVSGMTPGATEQFFVYAFNASTSTGSGWVSVSMPPLTAPTVSATAASLTAVNVSWTASPGTTGYYVDWYDGSTIHKVATLPASQTSIQVSGMTPGAFEQFYVYAYNGPANAGSGWVGLTMPPLTAPALTATAASPTAVNLSWTAPPGAAGYYVDWYDGSTIHKVATLPASQTSIQVSGMTPGAIEQFFVYAYNGPANAGTGWVGLTMPKSTSQNMAPSLTVTAASPTTVNLSWTASPGAAGYTVEWYDGSAMHSVGTFGPSQTTVQVTGLTPGASEQFLVYASNGPASAGSGWVTLSMPSLTAPVLTATAASPTAVNLAWTAPPGTTGFYVDWYDGSTVHLLGTFDVSRTTLQVSGMASGATEQFFVYAYDGLANAGSGWVTLTMP